MFAASQTQYRLDANMQRPGCCNISHVFLCKDAPDQQNAHLIRPCIFTVLHRTILCRHLQVCSADSIALEFPTSVVHIPRRRPAAAPATLIITGHSTRPLLMLILAELQDSAAKVCISETAVNWSHPVEPSIPAVVSTGMSGSPGPLLPPATRTRTGGSSLRLGSVSGASRPSCQTDCKACNWHLDWQGARNQLHSCCERGIERCICS